MIKTYVYSENDITRKKIEELLDQRKERMDITFFDDLEEILKFYSEETEVDFIIIDLPKDYNEKILHKFVNRFHVFSYVPLMLYIGSDPWTAKAVNSEPFRFIERDNLERNFHISLDDALFRLSSSNKVLFQYKKNGKICTVDLDNVLYFYSELRNIRFIYRELSGEYVKKSFYGNLESVISQVSNNPNTFIRANKSFYLNKRYIHEINKKGVVMKNNPDEYITISQKYFEEFKNLKNLVKFG